VGGRGQCLGAGKKLEARKMLENAAESPASGARFVGCICGVKNISKRII